ncbi:hypothetical protein CIG19_02215 [Enterobacterales bacterium CwR94]|nr:hypothetical protein CIG19_02215 [Enterobacterales bacterium CwR94]
MIKKIILSAVMATALVSCASVGEDKYSEKYIRAHVIENKTTKAEIQSIYGAPDEQSTGSGKGAAWTYRKNDRLKSLTTLSGYIPGAESVMTSVGIAASSANQISSASNKVAGNTALTGNTLSFSFNEQNVVEQWNLSE